MEHPLEKRFPVDADDYKLYEEVGEGVGATVYRALCIPLNEIVAIKVLDLEKCNNDVDGIRREVQTMSLIDHPRAHCSFASGHNLWVVMPYMAGGGGVLPSYNEIFLYMAGGHIVHELDGLAPF
ncbi:serine/threonine-protein kinase BLUS1-like [Hibiscus syriacus]|uniref:serine/threonine-protein kinase BLUS1-like n=1 Tax=Hibiscus syriacus TaxID=106335 RepID=UPI001920FCE3|nr:serine/threonine-protein kinase BLUS1-like [Hibiscus syriacus]